MSKTQIQEQSRDEIRMKEEKIRAKHEASFDFYEYTTVYSLICIISLTGLEHKHTYNLACFLSIRTCNGVIRIALLQTC